MAIAEDKQLPGMNLQLFLQESHLESLIETQDSFLCLIDLDDLNKNL